MWDDSREALANLELDSRERVLDVGAGTGALTRVLREQSPAEVVAVDADPTLLCRVAGSCLVGDATGLPFRAGTFDLVTCQALLINLPDPGRAVQEFSRVSRDCVAVVEPDNSAVSIESTVDEESHLARRARRWYLQGLETNASLGAVRGLFERAGLTEVSVRRYDHERTVEPPYSQRALEGARRKASGSGLTTDRETILEGETTVEEFDELRQAWRSMGRAVTEQMQKGSYRQREVVPFFVTVGQV
jgi:SAM-dependent methyltransferase